MIFLYKDKKLVGVYDNVAWDTENNRPKKGAENQVRGFFNYVLAGMDS